MLSFLAPKITPLHSIKMCIFTFRICMSKGPGKWINNPITRKALQDHHVEVNVSNSSSDSGDTIKQPDIFSSNILNGPTGITTSPIFEISSRLQHHSSISDITGKLRPARRFRISQLGAVKTATFPPSLTFSLLTPMDPKRQSFLVDSWYQRCLLTKSTVCSKRIQPLWWTSVATLPLAPLVTNIDRLRTEYNSQKSTLERTTREWAESLTDVRGKSLQCDVENGGNNRAVLLLVPKENMPMATRALRAYNERIPPSTNAK